MSEIINYTRLTTSDKVEDRFLTCQVYQPIDPEQAESGMIFSQIEIMNPWFPTSQIGQTIINTLIREYYRGSDTSELVNFENAIKKVNEALAQIAQNGETDWIGKLNGVLVLYNKKEIHFAQTGTSQAYLYRGTKINHITEELDANEAPHPLKTFTNITSGTLEIGDKVAIANSAFFDVIKPLELRRIITSFNPTLTAIETAKILKMNGSRSGNAIFLELTTKEDLANVPPDQKIEAIYLDQTGGSVNLQLKNFYSSSIKPVASKIAASFVSFFHLSKKTLQPHLKKGWELTQKGSKSAVKKISSSGKDLGDKVKEKISQNRNDEPRGIVIESDSKLSAKTTLLKAKNKLRRLLIGLGVYSRQKSRMILPILIALIFALGLILGLSFYLRSRGNLDKNLQSKVDQVVSLENEAVVATTRGDKPAALGDYKQIISLSNDLKGTKYENSVSEAVQRARSKINELISKTNLTVEKTFNLDPQTITTISAGDSIISILKTGEVREKKPNLQTFDTIGQINLPSQNISSAIYVDESDKLAILFDNKALGTFDLQSKGFKVEKVKPSSTGKMQSFDGNLYILDPLKNQIWKEVYENNNYDSETPYITDNSVNISDIVDFAIDGNIFVMSKSGQITKLSRGKNTGEFKISLPLDEVISSWDGIFTSTDSSYIYAAANDNGLERIVKIDKSGGFISQYSLNSIENPDLILIDSANQKVFARKGDAISLYSF